MKRISWFFLGIVTTLLVELIIGALTFGIPLLWDPKISKLEKVIGKSLPKPATNTWNYSEFDTWFGDGESIELYSAPKEFLSGLVENCGVPAALKSVGSQAILKVKFPSAVESKACVWEFKEGKKCTVNVVAWQDFIARVEECL